MTTTEAPRAIGYVRISSDPTEARAGVGRQREDVAALAARLGAALTDIYEDNDVSAFKARLASTGWGRALAAIESSRPDFLLVFKMDRLGRRLADLEGLEELCRRTGTKVVSVVEGEVFRNTAWPILAAVAKMESQNTSTRVLRAQDARRLTGMPANGGVRPYGFKPDRRTPIARECKVVREMAERVLAGESVVSVKRWLNSVEEPTVRGGAWRTDGVTALLRNPRYAGRLVHKGKAVGSAAWEPVIEPDEWDRLQAVLDGRAPEFGPYTKTLLGGLLRCGRCMAPMSSNGADAYRCNRSANGCGRVTRKARMLDDYVTEWALERFSGDLVAEDRERAANEVARLKREEWELDGRITDAFYAFHEGRAESDVVLPILDSLRRRRAKTKRDLAVARHRLEVASAEGLPREHWQAWSLQERHQWLAQRIAVVTVNPPGKGSRALDPETVKVHVSRFINQPDQ